MDVSIMIEGQMGLNWPRWKNIAATVEELGFAGLYRSDHFTNARGPDQDSLELIPSLTYLATATSRLRFGQLVSPMSFRDPGILTRQVAAISDLSGGRITYGLGAGWQQREHDAFGFDLGTVRQRLDRLQEGLEVATLALRSDAPVTFEGRFFRLQDAPMLPRPAHNIPICVGGNGEQRTLQLVARYADVWNAVALPPEQFVRRSQRLDELLDMVGRKPSEVRRTMMLQAPAVEQVRTTLDPLAEAGCEEVMLQWLALDDIDGLQRLAEVAL